MKKRLIYIPILLLIFATIVTKNSTKKLDKNIYKIKENIRLLENKYELVLLDFNYLSSPKKLMDYQKKYFDSDLIETKITNLKSIKIKNKNFVIKNIHNNHE